MSERRDDPISAQERAEPVIVVPYDPQWARTFEQVRDRVVPAVGDVLAGVEHVGSTAVPGLAAKPIVDVDVVVRNDRDVPEAIRRLAAIGYEHLGDLGIAGREAFRAAPGLGRHHLYVLAPGPVLRAHLLLRDALRADRALADAYAALKIELSERFRNDRDAYAEGKTQFIAAVLLADRPHRRRAVRG
ncbi:MAG TPA: GrpB family protein [Candidatus Elarobacter sp.]